MSEHAPGRADQIRATSLLSSGRCRQKNGKTWPALPQSSSTATALTGDPVPSRIRRGNPIKVKRLPTTWSRLARFSNGVIQYVRHIIWHGYVRLIGLSGLGESTPNVLIPFSTSHILPASFRPGYWLSNH